MVGMAQRWGNIGQPTDNHWPNGSTQCHRWSNVVMLSGKGEDQLHRHISTFVFIIAKAIILFTWPPKLNFRVFSLRKVTLYRKIINRTAFKLPKTNKKCPPRNSERIKTIRVGREKRRVGYRNFYFFYFVYKISRVGALNQGRSGYFTKSFFSYALPKNLIC